MDELTYLTGILLDWPSREISRAEVEKCRRLRFVGTSPGSKWEQYVYDSPKALRGENADTSNPPYRYEVFCRRSGSRILVLSLSRQVVEHVLREEFDRLFSPNLRRVSIGVQDLVKNIASNPTIYLLSFVHARVPGFGASLRSVSFYGEDLAEASLFKDHLELMVFFTCGLREATGGSEIVRLGGDGTVSFLWKNEPRRFLEVEEALRFLRRNGFLTTEIWPDEVSTRA